MVAITVILAAVIGSFVLGIGGDISETPQVRLAASDASEQLFANNNDDVLTIEHQGGDTIAKSDLNVKVSSSNVDSSLDNSQDFTVGSTITLSESSDVDVTSGTEIRVRVIHKPSDNLLLDTTATVN
jgi:FlaG/FlaF family flagellin (archaellin)